MKKILLTGSTGFIGRNLKESLIGKYDIFAPEHKELELLDYKELESYVIRNQIDIIIHAAIHVPMFNGSQNEFYNDMRMFANIEKLSTLVEKVLYFGSGAEYDKNYDIRMVKEEQIGESIPTSEYGLAKYTMNMIARRSDNIYNLRLFGIFGKYELWNIKFISNLCCKAMFDLPLTIRKDCYFDFLFIEDLPEIIQWFIKNRPKYHDYNVCHGREYLLSTLADIVREVSNKKLEINILSPMRNLDYSASNSRLADEMNELKITAMKSSIAQLYHYYQENRNLIDYEVLRNSR